MILNEGCCAQLKFLRSKPGLVECANINVDSGNIVYRHLHLHASFSVVAQNAKGRYNAQCISWFFSAGIEGLLLEVSCYKGGVESCYYQCERAFSISVTPDVGVLELSISEIPRGLIEHTLLRKPIAYMQTFN
jgi:hypothetical protein